MRKINLLCIIVLTGMLSSSKGVSDVFASASAEEIVHSIFEYDFEYQERARAGAAEMMKHMSEESYVRWRPVRVEPNEVLREKIDSDDALPESLQLTLFPDMIVSAQRTRYSYIETTGDAIWEGVIPGFENSRVEITIVDSTDKLANKPERITFVIRIWDPPRHSYILPVDDQDVYVAIEGRVSDNMNSDWAPNN